MSFDIMKNSNLVCVFTMTVCEGWNILTLYESAGFEFEEQYPDIKGDWVIYVNGNVAEDSYEIKQTDKIHMELVVQLIGM